MAGRQDLVAAVGRGAFDDEVRRRWLVAAFPRAYCRPWDADLIEVRRRAALVSVGGENALSHLTALEQWNLPAPAGGPLHVTAYQPRHPRGVPRELIVHRTLRPLTAILVDGVPTVSPAVAVATSWPLLRGADQRAPSIEATRRGLVSATGLTEVARTMWWLKGVVGFRDPVGRLLAGCESELELFGYLEVFGVSGLQHGTRQRVVRSGGKAYRLDLAYDEEMVAIELDGRTYHAGSEQWERDIVRDRALAAIGWQTIRFSHAQLTGDVAGCRREALSVLTVRRAG